MDEDRARALVARERRRIEAALVELAGRRAGRRPVLRFDQTGESQEAGTAIQQENVDRGGRGRLAEGTRCRWSGPKLASARARTAYRSRAAHASPTTAWKPSPLPSARSRSSGDSSRRPIS